MWRRVRNGWATPGGYRGWPKPTCPYGQPRRWLWSRLISATTLSISYFTALARSGNFTKFTIPLTYRGAGAAAVNRPYSAHHCRIPDQSCRLSRRSFYGLGDAQSFEPQIEPAVSGTDPDYSTPSPLAPRSRNGGSEFRDVLHILGSNARDFRSGRT